MYISTYAHLHGWETERLVRSHQQQPYAVSELNMKNCSVHDTARKTRKLSN